MYKKISIILICCFWVVQCMAQFKNARTIAPFAITLANGQSYKYTQLVKGQPVILVYFSPTCEHCIDFTKAMIKRIAELKNKQIIMVTYLPLADVQSFNTQFKLASYPNIKVGTEGYTFIVQKYYQVQVFPYIAAYDKQGRLVKLIADQKIKPEVMAAEL